jgi:adenylate cyclase
MSDRRTRDDTLAARGADSAKPSAAAVRVQLERILASRYFQTASGASRFLRFVTEQTLLGDGQRLKGYTIGVEVFGRPADFDAQSDALVRVEAGRLRRRLVDYYAGEGAADPIRIELPRGSYAIEYRCNSATAAAAAAPTTEKLPPKRDTGSTRCRSVAAALAALLVSASGVIVWQQTELQTSSRAPEAGGVGQQTDWPRIVVVPFENLGADDALDPIAASMTEEIMLRLDQLDLFVVASQASWYGSSGAPSLATAAGGYLLTGSVRGSATAPRITVRLIEAGSGTQLWTAAYDQPLGPDHRPTLQEQVARDVAAAAAPYGPIFEAELARARRSVQEPQLRDCLASYHEYRRRIVSQAHRDAVACFESVSVRQPDVARVWSGLAMLYVDEYASAFGRGGEQALEAARAATAKALELDREDFFANMAFTRLQFFDGDARFRQSIERTLALRPNSVQALAQSGFLLAISGSSAHGLPLIQRARELAKTPPALCHLAYAVTYLREGRFAEALAAAERVDARNWVLAQAVVAAAAAQSGRQEVASEAARRLRELYPQFEAEALANFARWHFDAAFYEVLVSGLEAAGLELRDRTAQSSAG